MDEWKEKIIFHFHKIIGKDETKNAAAAQEACKSFDESKDAIIKELEEKKVELKPKVIQIYEASSKEVKTLIKEPKGPALKKHSPKVVKFLEELVKIGFPGSKAAYEASSKYGTALAQDPVIFVFIKVSTFIVAEEAPSAVTTREIVNVDHPHPPTNETPAATIQTREIVVVNEADHKKEELTKVEEKKEPPLTAIKTKEIIVEQPHKPPTTSTEAATNEPPVTAIKAKEAIVAHDQKELPKAEERKEEYTKQEVKTPPPPPTTSTETSTKEPLVAAVEPKEIIVQKVAHEKEPPKAEDKKEEPSKT